ncbi:MAG TPA: hypothetical protein VEO54_15955 [Thermoanaerobaculia bacterium]|nr:hypothetical protein [Thermoanaerobaculia bacterium]
MNGTCASCRRTIDAAAKICPYCGSDPATGEKVVDTQAVLQEVFHPREISTSESVLEFARQRQGFFIIGAILLVFLLLAGVQQIMQRRTAAADRDSPAVPLTEITDMANQTRPNTPTPMPELDFPFEGRPQKLRTFIVERGAVAPAPPAPPATTTTTTQAPAAPQPPAPRPQR